MTRTRHYSVSVYATPESCNRMREIAALSPSLTDFAARILRLRRSTPSRRSHFSPFAQPKAPS